MSNVKIQRSKTVFLKNLILSLNFAYQNLLGYFDSLAISKSLILPDAGLTMRIIFKILQNYSEMFARLERQVEMKCCRNYEEVKMMMESWMGSKWRETSGQLKLVRIECKRLGIPVRLEGKPRAPSERGFVHVSQAPSWRHETVTVKGKSQERYRDLQSGRFIQNPFKKR
jgi:hypothetical protein